MYLDPASFPTLLSGLTLRSYQVPVARAVVDSVLNARGLSFVVIFPRQSGKNELQAQLETYLLARLSGFPAEMVKVSPTWKPQSLNAMRRLERVLNANQLTRGRWSREHGYIYRLGQARLFFLSGQPGANIVGATANLLLEVDEAQNILIDRYDKDISPMAASANATRLFWGTAWTPDTLLGRERRLAGEAQRQDGIQRVFTLTADDVAREVPAYGQFVAEQIERFGRHHPLIRTQFFSEELTDSAGLFTPARRALMQGTHPPHTAPLPGCLYAFLLDVGGESFSSSPLPHLGGGAGGEALLPSPRGGGAGGEVLPPSLFASAPSPQFSHDLTALTIVEVLPAPASSPPLPLYRVVARFGWQGVSHADLYPLLRRLRDGWHSRYFVIDATGLGAGLASFLSRIWPPSECLVVPFTFTARSKSDLGWSFLSLIETGRFQDHAPSDTDQAYLDFWRQLPAVTQLLRPDQSLSWGVPPGVTDPLTHAPLHDDWVLSASLCALLDKHVSLSQGISFVIPAPDPLANLRW
jgi:hypothetical protein